MNHSAESALNSLNALKDQLAERNGDILVSITAVIAEDISDLEQRIQRTMDILAQQYRYYEFLVVDSGCVPGVSARIEALQRSLPNVRFMRLSRRYGREVAMTAALDHCIGDYVVLMDLGSDPPEQIPALISKALSGYDAVIAEPSRTAESFMERLITRAFYGAASRVLGFQLRPEESCYRVLSRRIVNSMVRIKSKNRYLSWLSASVGYRQSSIHYEPANVPSKARARNLLRRMFTAISIVVSNSAAPLRFASLLGILASFANLIYLFYIFAVTLVKHRIAEGWITTSLTQTTMFLLLFLIISILAEYTARILDETKDQPLYFVEYETNSSVATPAPDRLNVV